MVYFAHVSVDENQYESLLRRACDATGRRSRGEIHRSKNLTQNQIRFVSGEERAAGAEGTTRVTRQTAGVRGRRCLPHGDSPRRELSMFSLLEYVS
ncbi:hypothetical protein EVAR_34395_1 [Eumeta japonica]|uniref:Uncharacterized protein n=1 Tax=Eumeta variegata TaxID=151549 RepID=A0A4C1WW40_EUMVA|nr:hypothetical protein EVAR_34395_1 [Eumeta japonica]